MKITNKRTTRGRLSFWIDVPRTEVQIKTDWLPDFAPLDDRDDGDIVVVHDNDELPVLCIAPIFAPDRDRLVPLGEHNIIIRVDGVEHLYKLNYGGRNVLTVTAAITATEKIRSARK